MKYVVDETENKKVEEKKEKTKKPKKERKKLNFSKLKPLRAAVVSFLIFTAILGLGYTLSVTIFAQTLFPYESNGSVIEITLKDGTKRVIGSELIGQSYLKMDSNGNYVLEDEADNLYVTNDENIYFLDSNKNLELEETETTKLAEETKTNVIFQAKYLIGRFNQGSPSNSAVTTQIYKETLQSRQQALIKIGYNEEYNTANNFAALPSELLTESGSGVDPEISYDVAMYQVPMIAKVRNMEQTEVKEIIKKHTINKLFGIFGTKRVNVLLVNLELDGLI